MKRLLKDPAFHFTLLAGLLFALYFAAPNTADPVPPPPQTTIVVTPEDLNRLARGFQSTWKRLPTEEELTTLLKASVEDEVLIREALALGLDQNDASIRQRLVQKMRFLMESTAQALQPDDAALQAHLDAYPARFSAPARLSFLQVYLGDRPTQAEADALQAELMAGADPATTGVRTMIPLQFEETVARKVDAQFGRGFAVQLSQTPQEGWHFVTSGLGGHLVKVTEISAPQTPPLAEVKEKVQNDWRRHQAEILTAAQIADLVAKYDISLPDDAAMTEALAN